LSLNTILITPMLIKKIISCLMEDEKKHEKLLTNLDTDQKRDVHVESVLRAGASDFSAESSAEAKKLPGFPGNRNDTLGAKGACIYVNGLRHVAAGTVFH